MSNAKKQLNIVMLGHKRIPSREGGVEIVVEELSTRIVNAGHKVTCLNRAGKHVSRMITQPGLTCYWQIQKNRNELPFEE